MRLADQAILLQLWPLAMGAPEAESAVVSFTVTAPRYTQAPKLQEVV